MKIEENTKCLTTRLTLDHFPAGHHWLVNSKICFMVL